MLPNVSVRSCALLKTLSGINHISGTVNPADLLSHSVTNPCKLLQPNKKNTTWFTGLTFLSDDEDSRSIITVDALDSDDSEIKATSAIVSQSLMHKPLEVYCFSSWPKLKLVTAYCIRWIYIARCSRTGNLGRSGEPTSEEINSVVKKLQSTLHQLFKNWSK